MQGLQVTVAAFNVWGLWLERQRLKLKGQKGKAKEESVDSVELGKATAKREKEEGMLEMQELDPKEPAHDCRRDANRDAGRAMRGTAGEGSSKMAETRHVSRGLSITCSAGGSMAGRWPSFAESDHNICLGHERGKIQAYDLAMRNNARVRPKLQVRRGGRWEDDKDAIEPIPR